MAEPSVGARTFHLSLNVADLGRSVAFYRTLFGQEPARHEPDYAKFEVADPPVVLALEPNQTNGVGALNHVGVRVASADEVAAMQDRLVAAGLETQFIASVECCYSRQTKICTWDPDRTLWEIYVLEEDAATGLAAAERAPLLQRAGSTAADSREGRVIFNHLLGSPFPGAAERPAPASADEVRLRGTLNAAMDAGREMEILRAVLTTLRPGGRLTLHMMVGDRPVARPLPRMPGPAAHVERVPVVTDVLRSIESAGFVGLSCTRYSHSPVFRASGVEMRELLLTAWKRDVLPEQDEGERAVLYKGPFRSITDDDGVVYPRGQHVLVGPRTFQALRRSTLADHFVFVTTDASCGDGCAS
jgi:catechol 2,3-dioxygenase-like lactoylglutathione lyase family enzyme